MLKAKELDISPEELVSKVRAEHMATYEAYDINFTNYHTTHSDENKKFNKLVVPDLGSPVINTCD